MNAHSGKTAVVTGASSGIGRRATNKRPDQVSMLKGDVTDDEAPVLAATATRPRRRYTAGKIARQVSILRRFAPAETFDKRLRKQMRLFA